MKKETKEFRQTIPIEFTMEPDCMDLIPEQAHDDDAAYDLKSRIDAIIDPGKTILVPTGFRTILPATLVEYDAATQKHYVTSKLEAQVRSRSGNALKHQVFVLNSPGTIDAGYRGEYGVILCNLGSHPFSIHRGDRVAQLVFNIIPLVEFKFISKIEFDQATSERGAGGFGSTGK